MSSAVKTLELLSFFTPSRPQIGLSQMCKLARRDKATTYRHLKILQSSGLLEQNPVTKQFRLGPMVLQLASTREAACPRKSVVERPLQDLAAATGETAHVTILSGDTVYALADCESRAHSARATVDIQTFPLHATASGLCSIAYGPAELLETAIANLHPFTTETAQTSRQLEEALKTVRETGFAHASKTFEDEIYGISTPVFAGNDEFAGTVSVASVATRFDPQLESLVLHNLIKASREITRVWGGTIPPDLETIWAKTLSKIQCTEQAS